MFNIKNVKINIVSSVKCENNILIERVSPDDLDLDICYHSHDSEQNF